MGNLVGLGIAVSVSAGPTWADKTKLDRVVAERKELGGKLGDALARNDTAAVGPTSSIELDSDDSYGADLELLALHEDGRAIAGCGSPGPGISVSSPNVAVTVDRFNAFCGLHLDRLGPGDATVTLTWGRATVTIDVVE